MEKLWDFILNPWGKQSKGAEQRSNLIWFTPSITLTRCVVIVDGSQRPHQLTEHLVYNRCLITLQRSREESTTDRRHWTGHGSVCTCSYLTSGFIQKHGCSASMEISNYSRLPKTTECQESRLKNVVRNFCSQTSWAIETALKTVTGFKFQGYYSLNWAPHLSLQ